MPISAIIRIPGDRVLEFHELHRQLWQRTREQNPDVSSVTVQGPASLDGWETFKVDARFLPELSSRGFPFEEVTA